MLLIIEELENEEASDQDDSIVEEDTKKNEDSLTETSLLPE